MIIRSTSVDLEGSIEDTEEKDVEYTILVRLSAFLPLCCVCVNGGGEREGRWVRQMGGVMQVKKGKKKSASPLSQRPQSTPQLFFWEKNACVYIYF